MKFKNILPGLLILLFAALNMQAQSVVDKTKGNHRYTKLGYMDGNLVETLFYNYGEIGDYTAVDKTRNGAWPKGSGHTYVDGIAVIVQAEATTTSGQKIHPLETNYYEFTRKDIATQVTYGWAPLPGYANAYQSIIARSDDKTTWPSTWPDRTSDWDGSWNGYFGKGLLNADLESYFVFDDNEDRDYINKYSFYPDAADLTRGGLGMQVKARGFQWSQVLAEDVVFWYYEITNMGTTDYAKSLFAQYVDWGIGGHDNSSNNAGDYDEVLAMSYAWSVVSYGSPGNWTPVGYAGYAFLESPGVSDDGKDNDHDGLTDERRDNVATKFITDLSQDPFIKNIATDTSTFSTFYGRSWKAHWDADENGNWKSYEDVNNNGKWDSGEPINDDVGTDGIGPYDADYTGPDADGSEGNGKPDQGEPDFGILDKDESDQLGLTGFAIYAVHRYELTNDEENWTVLSGLPTPHQQSLVGVNLGNYFSSYLFHLNGRNTYSATTGTIEETGETQRFSMALIFGTDASDLFRRKKTVQSIYNASYNFAKPPEKPIVKAIAGDGKVTLYWDNRAETTFDAFYQKVNFEGYRIYRSTESNFVEDKTITDAYGKATFRKAIAIFDLVDGVSGLHPVDIQGAKFDLGTDSGLRHSYIDTTVQNGQTYYYAVCSYDQGYVTTNVAGTTEGIPPSETTSIIKVATNGTVRTDVNTAVVTPHAPAAGYVSSEVNSMTLSGPGTGTAAVNILDPDSLKNFHTYRLEYQNSSVYQNDAHPYYQLIDYTGKDTLIKSTKFISDNVQTLTTDGFSLSVTNDTSVIIDTAKTKWITGNSNYIVTVGFDSRFSAAYLSKKVNYPADFEITFCDSAAGDSSFQATSFSKPILSNIRIKNLTEGTDHFQFIFRDQDADKKFTSGDAIFLAFGDSLGGKAVTFSNLKVGWSVTIQQDTAIAAALQRPPQTGDVFRFSTKKPYRTGEYVEFVTKSPSFSKAKAKGELGRIAVVPNPYVGAASWEAYTTDVGRGPRLVQFIHLPSQCTIRIYTINGALVKTLEHNSNISDGQESWNLTTKDGMNLAYGVYIFHVDAPGIGETIGKFAVIK
jgi:hypothetical protein